MRDLGSSTRVRKIAVELIVPGQQGDPRLPDEARFSYQEWWRTTALGWVRVRYAYDFFDLVHSGRRGYHLHPIGGRAAVPHAHCVPPGGAGEERHYDAYEVDLLEAHEAFEVQYASGRPIDCHGLRGLD
jgi:hypothetical protein